MSTSTPNEDEPTFDVLNLCPEVRQAVDELGYVHPTPVQRAVFEPALRGRDLVVQARTGTGKTAAFGLPLANTLVRRNLEQVQALILCPTRELALQVANELVSLAKHRGLKTVAVYGGAAMQRQITELEAGAQILVGTPGRVLDHLRRGTLDASQVRVVVLDESDEMLSMGFLPQINEIMSFVPPTHQTLLFSATLPPAVRRVVEARLRNPEYLTLSGDHIGALEVQHLVYWSHGDKLGDFFQLLEVEDPESAIVFCNTREQTKRVSAALGQRGYAADWLNADLAQNEREKVMAATRKGEVRFLVATDVASRGIDISHLTHVLNFDFPESAEAYVHRTGRTGRAGRTGTAVSLATPSDVGNIYLLRLTYGIRPTQCQLPSRRELKTREEADVVESLVRLFETRAPAAADRVLARRLLTHQQAEIVVAGLLRDHLAERPSLGEDAATERRARRAKPVTGKEAAVEPGARRGGPTANDAEPPAHRSAQAGDGAPARAHLPSPPAPVVVQTPEPSDSPALTVPVPAAVLERRAAQGEGDDGHDDPPNADEAEVYVSVGRRDGLRAQDLEALLAEAGLDSDVRSINVRQRHTFIRIARPALEAAIGVLDGAMVCGRQALAEEARPRLPQAESLGP